MNINKIVLDNEALDIEDVTARNSISALSTVASTGSYNDLKDKPTIPPGVIIDSELSTTSEHSVQNKVITTALNGKVDTSSLSTVATSGNYIDLSGTPFIPTFTYSSNTLTIKTK